jgi:heme-degrading monooxygenase HmoA
LFSVVIAIVPFNHRVWALVKTARRKPIPRLNGMAVAPFETFRRFSTLMGERTMATISKDRKLMTLVNVFTVDPEKQTELANLLISATNDAMRHLPGFISASIHRSVDGTKVVNYAQWRSQEDFAALKENPKARPHMEAAAKLAKFDPIVCEVVDSIAID